MEVKSTSQIMLRDPGARPVAAKATPAPTPVMLTIEPAPSRLERALAEIGREAKVADFPEKVANFPERQLKLDVDKASGRVVGSIIDKASGELVSQIPSKAILSLLEKTRAMLGPLVDEQA